MSTQAGGRLVCPPRSCRDGPRGAHVEGQRLVLLLPSAVAVSDDGAQTFQKYEGGGQTNSILGGESLALTSSGELAAVQSYSWGVSNANQVALLVGDPQGTTWTRSVVRATDHYVQSPRVAAWGDWLVVVWLEGAEVLGSYAKNDVYAAMTQDRGLSWTAPVKLNESKDGQNITGLQAAGRNGTVAVVWAETGESLNWDLRGVFLSVLRQ